ncbi:MAG: methyltransferase domain-containing protein [Candidatus Rokubacteria bacterium]|nr:methyltransferase domain-containing protein [Candidatus Rokubacteria bacterium]
MKLTDETAVIPELIRRHLDIFMCPVCGGRLKVPDDHSTMECAACKRVFACDQGIPLLFWPTGRSSKADVTDLVKAFYEETPFPGYDDLDSPESLRAKAENGVFARLLSGQIAHGSKVLECGCGTGQLSNFLGLTWGRSVFATDLCVNSLRLGHAFEEQHGLENVCFVQMNLFRPVFRPEVFDFVICNGVLHHTADPFAGFQALLPSLKKGGFVVVGLYNRYGRLTTDIRRLIFRVAGDRLTSLDPRLRTETLNDARRRAWFRDQYKHPHESKHTFGEVLRWFDQSSVEFVNSIPKCVASESFSPGERLFEPNPRGTAVDRAIVQAAMLLTGGREGGFFTMIGRKRA